MVLDKEIALVEVGITRTAERTRQQTEKKRFVFASVRDPARAEFYQASRSGYNASLVAMVWEVDYEGERILEYKGKTYTVIRTREMQVQGFPLVEIVAEERLAKK